MSQTDREAFAANSSYSTAQDCLARGLPLNFSGVNPSSNVIGGMDCDRLPLKMGREFGYFKAVLANVPRSPRDHKGRAE